MTAAGVEDVRGGAAEDTRSRNNSRNRADSRSRGLAEEPGEPALGIQVPDSNVHQHARAAAIPAESRNAYSGGRIRFNHSRGTDPADPLKRLNELR